MNKQMKKITIGALIAGQILTAQVMAAPQNVVKEFNKQQEVRMELGNFKQDIKIFLVKNGQRVRIDQNMKDGLRVISGRTCVGVRDLTNAIEGARVDWDGANKVVDVYNNGKSLAYPINKKLMWDGVQIKGTDVPATIDAAISKTFLPLRSIAENLGYRVDWEDATHEVTLVKPGENYVKEPAPAPQPKPAPSQGKASAYMTASGQKLMTPEEFKNFPKESVKFIPLTQADITDDGGPLLTVLKGTAYEFQIHKPFKKVTSSPANPNFKILGENKGDSRVGTYIWGPGEASYEKGIDIIRGRLGNDEEMMYTSLNGKVYPYDNWETSNLGNGPIESFLTNDRLINQSEVKKFISSFEKSIVKDLLLDKSLDLFLIYDNPLKVISDPSTKYYDMTGILDMSVENYISNSPTPKISADATLFITREGYLIPYNAQHNLSSIKDSLSIDKVVSFVRLGNKWDILVTDIPDINHKLLSNEESFRLGRKMDKYPKEIRIMNRGW